MIRERIRSCLTKKGLQHIEVNVRDIYLHYVVIGQEVYIVLEMDCPTGSEFTSEQYNHIIDQIHHNFSMKDYGEIRMLTIIYTNNAGKVRELFREGEEQWIIDTSSNQLILYENQDGDFLNLKEDIENTLLSEQSQSMNKRTALEGQSYEYSDRSTVKGKTFRPITFTKCNTAIVVLNIIIYFIVDINSMNVRSSTLLEAGALYWPSVFHKGEYYRLFTYMFLHYGFKHLADNMFVLLFIGDNLERAIGKWRYLILYFASGVIAGIVSLSYNMIKNSNAVSVGASGAIFGVVGAMALIVIVNKGHLEEIRSWQILLFVLFSLYGGLTSQGIDNAAHIGGLVTGAVLAALLYRKPKKKQMEGDL